MRWVVLIALTIAVGVGTADARKRGHYGFFNFFGAERHRVERRDTNREDTRDDRRPREDARDEGRDGPRAREDARDDRRSREEAREDRRGRDDYGRRGRGRDDGRGYARVDPGGLLALVPRDWEVKPAENDRPGTRYVSRAGDAWVEIYGTPAQGDEQHWKEIAFADGEELTYLKRERDFIAVSGTKGDTMFFRKAVLACRGLQWRHLSLEYPASAQRSFERLVSAMSRALDRGTESDCTAPLETKRE